MEQNDNYLIKIAIISGLIIALVTVVTQLVSFYILPALMGSMVYGFGVMFISLIIFVLLTLDMRKRIGGYWSFKEALKGIFLMAFISGITSATFNLLFYKFVEPNAVEKIQGYVVDGLTATYERLNISQEDIDNNVLKAKNSLQEQYNPTAGQFAWTLTIMILVEFVMSLIFAGLFKKEQPRYMQRQQETMV
ncbi:MAG: DUF4199 domain-containing protein [Sphingobacteriaceae bacterium]